LKEHNLVGKEIWMKVARQSALKEHERMNAHWEMLKMVGLLFWLFFICEIFIPEVVG